MSDKNNSFFIYKTKGNNVKNPIFIKENSTIKEILNEIIKKLNIQKDINDCIVVSVNENNQEIPLSSLIKKGMYMVSNCQNDEYEIKMIKAFASNLD